jgi:HSP20 family protein
MLAHALGLHTQQANGRTSAWAPALDISERKDAYLVTVELPGLKPEDLDITMEDGLLTIQGERQFTSESSEQQYHRVERSSGAFRRAITLPAHVMADAVEASMEDGVLRILVPRPKRPSPSASRSTPAARCRGTVASGDHCPRRPPPEL